MDDAVYWHAVDIKTIFKLLKTSEKGLTSEEVKRRRKEYGENEITLKENISALKLFLNQFSSPLVITLIIAAAVLIIVSLMSNDSSQLIDASLIIFIVLANSVFGFFQDYKAEKSMLALRKMTKVNVIVVRDGVEQIVDAKELVPGDIIIVEEGSKIPADARIIGVEDAYVNESVLTGESTKVRKEPCVLPMNTPLHARKNMLFMTTTVTMGSATAVVVGTGINTEVGRIAKQIHETEQESTIFQVQLESLSKSIGSFILGIIVFIALVQAFVHAFDLKTIFLTSVALAVAAIPEGLPAVVTLSLAYGTSKMVKKNALVRRLAIIESLGSVDVICTDKTGTLTENKMTVKKIYFDNKMYDVTGSGLDEQGEFISDGKIRKRELYPILLTGVLCNNAHVGKKYFGEPLEVALLIAGKKAGIDKKEVEKKYKHIKEIPFNSERKRMTVIYLIDGKKMAFMKGAPEVVLQHCTYVYENGKNRKLSKKRKKELLSVSRELEAQGFYVLGFAQKELNRQSDAESNMVFLGFQGMIDPPRPEVKEAIAACETAGIRVIMITGDSPLTAKNIAKQVGIGTEVMIGEEVDKITDKELENAVETIDIFARVSPHHKVRILNALRANEHVIAMTGDGVNDAPALKSADVGIAMGVRGTDVAREASDMILLDDNFATIAEAIKEGRTIYGNIKKFINYLLTSNFAEVFAIFIASLFAYLPVTAVQLLWINFVTDGFPAVALGADPPPPDIMKRKPKKKDEHIIDRRMWYLIALIGVENTILILSVFFIGLGMGGLKVAQTMAFTGFVLYEFVRIVVIRTQEKLGMLSNHYLTLAMIISIGLQFVLLYSPLNKLFGVVPLGIENWAVLITGTIIGYVSAIFITRWVMRMTA
ncbi:MAG: calcium-translocating P-type ATPase, PMCA-type [Candidatus Diapherotrites archaeon]|nr:calcium-translocating P-type ATPase, PMCA-type [Candidatus Diapherotrites archaeon]